MHPAIPLALLCCVAAACKPAPAPAEAPPWVLVATLDTTRADALGCLSGDPTRTPHLNALAARGALFPHALSVAPITLPSHCSLFSGLLPFEHGVRDNGTYELREDVETLAEVLAAAGYECGAVVAAPVLDACFGLDQGFTHYADAPDSTTGRGEGRRSAADVVQESLSWLRQRQGPGPVFLWAHFFDPHRPWEAPQEYFVRFGVRGEPGLDPLERERRAYAACVAYLDDQLARLFTGFEDAAAARSPAPPLIVVAADHGEGMGDHGERAHGYFLYDTTLRVPLILAGRGVPSRRIEVPVSLVDVFPTVLELVGLAAPHSSGQSLLPLLRDAPFDAAARPLYFESCLPYTSRWSPLYGLREGRFKLIESPQPELFDLNTDPGEQVNVLARHPGEAAALRAALRAQAERMAPSLRRGASAEFQSELAALGYVAAGSTGSPEFLPGVVDPTLRDTKDCREQIRLVGEAHTLFLAGDSLSAARVMREALALDPDNPFFLSQAGGFLLGCGKVEEALPLLRRSVEIEPAFPNSWLFLSQAHTQRRDLDAAIECLQRLLELDPAALDSRLELARLLSVHRGEHAQALTLLRAALAELAPQDPRHARVAAKITELENLVRDTP